MKKRLAVILSLVFISAMGAVIILNPEICKASALNGLAISANVIIPSLFPFTFCVVFAVNIISIINFHKFSAVTEKLFNMPFSVFCVFLISLVGGYPLGAKMLDTLCKTGKIEKSEAENLLLFCVNAGPAFIIAAVGGSVFHNRKIGTVLFFSHILSSVVMMLFSTLKKSKITASNTAIRHITVAENLTLSVDAAAQTTIGICAYTVLFSVICGYFRYFGTFIPLLNKISLLLEISNAVTKTNSIYLASFLLGFACISVWLQIFSLCKSFCVKKTKFILSRILHGLLSVLFTKLFTMIFNVEITAAAVNRTGIVYSTPQLSFSLVIMALLFMISLASDKAIGKIPF